MIIEFQSLIIMQNHFFDGEKVDGNNEVVIYDFKTDSYSKYFDESLQQYDVRTVTEGRSQILDNW